MTNEIHCAKCNRPMQVGFMLDHGHLNARTSAVWVEGEPKPSFWSGLSLSGKMAYEVQSFRCPRCGRLEFFANRPAGL